MSVSVLAIMIIPILTHAVSVVGAAIGSAYLICAMFQAPFYNPTFSKKQVQELLATFATNIGILGAEIVGSAWFYYPLLDTQEHSWVITGSNMIQYSLWIEMMYYVYHRCLHASNVYTHRQHHVTRDVYPMDTFVIHWLDSTGMLATLIFPLCVVRVNVMEFKWIMYMYLTSALLLHSKLFIDHHVIHHERYKCNYCFLFPIFDYIFGTST